MYTGTPRTLKRINALIKDIERNGCIEGIGNPEPLRGNFQGTFSRRINEKDRLVYRIENDRIYISHCKGHYDDN
ncbi:MAG: Txe/YoeB family addiction module toxin [Synergistaceae bacterium]|nr:Txe/YoeB family addiction module toxin [Synergistaceae bacterium]MBQ3763736.1 Txe/YoeB family addiction module toxin [Synergistaceae bacterium]MBQ7267007.1 Txe/YoeB family addiction module toxin [Synergistaceae bacterium]